MLYSALAALAVIGAASASTLTQAAEADQITELPGLSDEIAFRQFSGYLTIDSKTGKNIHYWLVEAEESPETAPVVFWTNGGPGCSGLLGFFTEQGPFYPQADGSVELNEWRWNRIANMVFVEQPSGVGFSYSDDTSDYRTNDDQAALDNVASIAAFYERFPDLADNDLYISSESYGGHYMPELASAIVASNKAGTTSFNFRGFAVGNPYTTEYTGTPAMIDTYWGKQLVAKPTWDKWTAQGCAQQGELNMTSTCEVLMLDIMNGVGNLNPYALDWPVCVSAQQVWMADFMRKRAQHFSGLMSNAARTAAGLPATTMSPAALDQLFATVGTTEDYEPCGDSYTTTYLNRADVQAAIHVKAPTGGWEECSTQLRYEYRDEFRSMVPYYRQLLTDSSNPALRILVYSGDDDGVCATIGTQAWIYGMGFAAGSKKNGLPFWEPWLVDEQTSGYLTQFETPEYDGTTSNTRLTFLTVHGAGHEVPTYKPKQAYALFEAFLKDDYSFGGW